MKGKLIISLLATAVVCFAALVVLGLVLNKHKTGPSTADAQALSQACPACPAPEACPPPVACDPCPACGASVDAVGNAVVVRSSRSNGPEAFVALGFVHKEGGKWEKVSSAAADGPTDPEPVEDNFLGYAALRRLRQNPTVITDQAAVDGADGFICQQREKVLSCWTLMDGEVRGDKVLMINTFRIF